MIQLKSNLQGVLNKLGAKLSELNLTEPMLRTVATSMLPVVKYRIHVEGKDAGGGQIGEYSSRYLKFRQQGYKSKTVVRGNKKGQARPVMNYNRTADNKVIASLSRQLENDWSIQATGTGYGMGWSNPVNAEKAKWVEAKYRKKIFASTQDEKRMDVEIAQDYVKRVMQ